MLDNLLQKEILSIVLLGNFNPPIFQPLWFSSKGLLRESEAENAQIDVIHPELARYKIGDWLNVEITKSRCEFRTNMEPYFDVLRDLVIDTFKILNETPINVVGINNIFDISLASDEEYYKFGKFLTPLDLWNRSIHDARLLTLEILEEKSKTCDYLRRRIRISPGNSNDNILHGITININNHFTITEQKKSELTSIIEKSSKSIRDDSKTIADNALNDIMNHIR